MLSYKSILYDIKCRLYFSKSKIEKTLSYFYKLILLISCNNASSSYLKYDDFALQIGEKIFPNLVVEKSRPCSNKLLILNSAIYDFGGHTEVALRLSNVLKNDFDITFLVNNFFSINSEELAPVKTSLIKKIVKFVEFEPQTYEEKIKKLYSYIIDNQFSTIFVNIHPYDVISTVVLALIKKYTAIKICFFNHADHNFSLATSFADILITRLENNKPLVKYLKNNKKLVNVSFLEKTNQPSVYRKQDIDKKKEELGISQESFISLTGASFYKILSDSNQPYLKLINNLLKDNPTLVHIIIGNKYDNDKNIINKYIKKEFIDNKRLIILPPTSDFDFYINMADLFIDSFPQGSALTLIDCLRNKTVPIVKVNTRYPYKSFQCYLPKDYDYACKTPKEMHNKINYLIKNKNLLKSLQDELYSYYQDRYDIQKVKQFYMEILK